MPYLMKPLCRSCGHVMPNVTLLMLCRHCKEDLKKQADRGKH